jgi:RimJ/RimL family protein N-acetyltransferase
MRKSEKVTLSPITQNDLPQLFEWINDRETVLFNAPYKPVHADQHQRWFEGLSKRSDLAMFGIRLITTKELIGSCQLHSINLNHRNAELQIRLGNSRDRGQGYGTEACRLLVDYGFKDLNLYRIYLHVFTFNEAAIRTYKKIGCVQEGVLRKAVHLDGKWVDVMVMSLLQDEYEQK